MGVGRGFIWLAIFFLQEVTCLKSQSTGDVNVEVNACPGPDLRKILEEMRCKYEAMIDGNRKEVEAWYGSKVSCTPPSP